MPSSSAAPSLNAEFLQPVDEPSLAYNTINQHPGGAGAQGGGCLRGGSSGWGNPAGGKPGRLKHHIADPTRKWTEELLNPA